MDNIVDNLFAVLMATLNIIPQILILIALFMLHKRVKHFSIFLMIVGTIISIIAGIIQYSFSLNLLSIEQIDIFFKILGIFWSIAGFMFGIGFLIFAIQFLKDKKTLL